MLNVLILSGMTLTANRPNFQTKKKNFSRKSLSLKIVSRSSYKPNTNSKSRSTNFTLKSNGYEQN